MVLTCHASRTGGCAGRRCFLPLCQSGRVTDTVGGAFRYASSVHFNCPEPLSLGAAAKQWGARAGCTPQNMPCPEGAPECCNERQCVRRLAETDMAFNQCVRAYRLVSAA